VFVWDLWYSAHWLITSAVDRGFEVVCGLRYNRIIWLLNQEGYIVEKLNVKELGELLNENDWLDLRLKGNDYRVASFEVVLKDVGHIRLLISRQWLPAKQKWSKCNYLMGTDLSMSPCEILSLYLLRWPIEAGHRFLKQKLALGTCRVRSQTGQESFLVLILLAASYLALCGCRDSALYTQSASPYRLIATYRTAFERAQITYVYTQAQHNVPLKEILEDLRLACT